MPTLREAMDTDAATNTVPDIVIPEYNPMELLQAQTVFGRHVLGNPELTRLVNAHGPRLFATLLYTLCEDYEIDPNDPESLAPRSSAVEAEQAAIGILRGVAAAMGQLDGDITIEPADGEVDQDTDINPVRD